MAEDLRMRAEVVDRATKPLKDIHQALAAIRRTPGMDAATEWLGKFNEKATGFVKDGGGAAGVINAMGIGGLTAAASLAELVGHFKELSERTNAMRELGREVGLTVDQLNALNHAAASFGLAPDKMQAAINHFASQMPQFMRGFGELHDELAHRFPELTKKLMGEGMQDQLKDIFNFLGQDALQKDPQRQKQMAELFFGNGDDIERLFAKGGDAFLKSVQDYAKTLEPITAELMKQSEDLRKALLDFNDALERIETKTGPTVIRGMNEVLGEFTTLFDNLDRLEKWWTENSPSKKAADVGNALDDQATMSGKQLYDKYHGKGDFAPPADAADGKRRVEVMQAELAALQASIKADKNPVGFGVRHANDYGRIRELSEAIKQLQESLTGGGSAQKMSYRSGGAIGSMLQNASFGGFDEGSGGPIAAGVKFGVLAAFRELMEDGQAGAGGGGGIMNASYSPGGGGGGGGGGTVPNPYSGVKDSASVQEHLDFIRKVAPQLGINPNMAEWIARHEGLGAKYGAGDHGTSFGDFQMHYANRIPGMSLGGLGDLFNKETGLDGRDPRNWKALDLYALRKMREQGLTPWHSWHGGQWVGIDRNAPVPKHVDQGLDSVKQQTSPIPGFKLPPGGHWGQDSKGNPVPIGPDGQSLGPDGKAARVLPPPKPTSGGPAAALGGGGATKVDIHLIDPGKSVRRTNVLSTGGVMAKLHRWPSAPIATEV